MCWLWGFLCGIAAYHFLTVWAGGEEPTRGRAERDITMDIDGSPLEADACLETPDIPHDTADAANEWLHRTTRRMS